MLTRISPFCHYEIEAQSLSDLLKVTLWGWVLNHINLETNSWKPNFKLPLKVSLLCRCLSHSWWLSHCKIQDVLCSPSKYRCCILAVLNNQQYSIIISFDLPTSSKIIQIFICFLVFVLLNAYILESFICYIVTKFYNFNSKISSHLTPKISIRW